MIFAASTAPVAQHTEGSASSPCESGLFFFFFKRMCESLGVTRRRVEEMEQEAFLSSFTEKETRHRSAFMTFTT